MGYIAPVNMEQANQYHLRTIHNEDSPITWDRVQRVQFHKHLAKHQEFSEIYQQRSKFKENLREKKEQDNKPKSVYMPTEAKVKPKTNHYPEITGKGRFISESV